MRGGDPCPKPIFVGSVVRVGRGRGFVVGSPFDQQRLVITAAHCLPKFMAPHTARSALEWTYRKLLAPLGAKPAITAACAFVDLVADIAILEAPDDQQLPEEYDAFDEFIDAVPRPLKIGKLSFAPHAKTKAWFLSLAGEWIECAVSHGRPLAPLCVHGASKSIVGGMSGSPIILDDGSAIGVICTSSNSVYHGPNPYLRGNLPGWVLQKPYQPQRPSAWPRPAPLGSPPRV